MIRPTIDVRAAAERLSAGELVAIPTETVYGLAADATNPAAVAKVYALKGRPADHPLIVHCATLGEAWRCAVEVGEDSRELGEAFWPGPLTLVLSRAKWVSPTITGGQDTVAVRVPDHPLTRSLLEAVGRPLVAPSANRYGRVSPTTAQHVRDEFAGSNLMVLDGGPCDVGIESTIVDCRDPRGFRVLRPGKITPSEIERVLGKPALTAEAARKVRVSGDLESHYAPRAEVVTVEPGQLMAWVRDQASETVRTLVVGRVTLKDPLPLVEVIPAPADPEEYARGLYALLRSADEGGFDRVVFELPEASEIGMAIRDRLRRASAR